jgi:hypothetical protein
MAPLFADDLADALESGPRDAQSRTGCEPRELASQPGADPRAPERRRVELGFELGCDRNQMPAQPVNQAGAFADDLIAIVAEHSDLHGVLIGERDREAVDPVTNDRERDRARVDRMGLSGLA